MIAATRSRQFVSHARFSPQRVSLQLARCLSAETSGGLEASLSKTMLDLEAVLPGMSCSQLACTITSVQQTYRAAVLSAQAGHSHSGTQDVIAFYESVLPDRSWLLTFRAAVAQHLSSSSPEAAGSQPVATGAAHVGPTTEHSNCTPQQLSQILAGVAGLPVQVVQPLPIGFGTPRWSRPLAAADPAAWEAWLADVAAAYAAAVDCRLLQQPQQQQQYQQQHEQQQTHEQQQDGLLHQLVDVIISLACCMRWSNVNVDDDHLMTDHFRQKVLDCLGQQLQQQPQQQQPQQQQPQQQNSVYGSASSDNESEAGWVKPPAQSSSSTAVPSPQAPGSPAQEQQQQKPQQQQQQEGGGAAEATGESVLSVQREDDSRLQLLLAGSIGHRVTYSMLLLLLPPPRPALTAFFDATAVRLTELFGVQQLQGVVRGLLFLGAVPSEAWLRALVTDVRGRAALLEPKDVQVFVEAFRFFSSKASKAGWLQDATAQLEEFTLC